MRPCHVYLYTTRTIFIFSLYFPLCTTIVWLKNLFNHTIVVHRRKIKRISNNGMNKLKIIFYGMKIWLNIWICQKYFRYFEQETREYKATLITRNSWYSVHKICNRLRPLVAKLCVRFEELLLWATNKHTDKLFEKGMWDRSKQEWSCHK